MADHVHRSPITPARSRELGGVLFEPMRPAGMTPAQWREQIRQELRESVRRSLAAGGTDPFTRAGARVIAAADPGYCAACAIAHEEPDLFTCADHE